MPEKTEVATFGMGCFWKPDLLFSKLDYVKEAEVGYMGGDEEKFPNPTYEQVCFRDTGYAEVVNIEFEGGLAAYKKLLTLFWKNHNPTTKNRQGPDVGTQYRSVIFYHNLKQKKAAIESREKMQKKFTEQIVTEIAPAKTFFKAEEYHQKYLEKRGMQTCGI